ncbi:MAG: DoxX family protein [Deltaproteobacteria bacterium]|nr:DoxX family protein [Deltaproteobacteria bacterium]
MPIIETYRRLTSLFDSLQAPLLLLLRLYWGSLFFMAGKGKLTNIGRVVDFFSSLHIPMPLFNAYLVGFTELIGGALLFLGLFSRLAAIPLAISMVVAYLTAHIEATHQIFRDPENFISQAPFLFLLTALLVLAFGPGRFSVDTFLRKRFL